MIHRYWMILATMATFAAVVWFMDPFFLIILGVAPLLWIGLPVLLLACFRLAIAARSRRSLRPGLTLLSGVAAFGLFVGLAIPANRFVQERFVTAAKDYPAQVAPLLEAYRQAHGSYPDSLDQLPSKPVVPHLLRGPNSYRSDGTSYSFYFRNPGGLIDTWNYDNTERKWHLST